MGYTMKNLIVDIKKKFKAACSVAMVANDETTTYSVNVCVNVANEVFRISMAVFPAELPAELPAVFPPRLLNQLLYKLNSRLLVKDR